MAYVFGRRTQWWPLPVLLLVSCNVTYFRSEASNSYDVRPRETSIRQQEIQPASSVRRLLGEPTRNGVDGGSNGQRGISSSSSSNRQSETAIDALWNVRAGSTPLPALVRSHPTARQLHPDFRTVGTLTRRLPHPEGRSSGKLSIIFPDDITTVKARTSDPTPPGVGSQTLAVVKSTSRPEMVLPHIGNNLSDSKNAPPPAAAAANEGFSWRPTTFISDGEMSPRSGVTANAHHGDCDVENGYLKSGDDGRCKKLFSTEDCDVGKWFVFDGRVSKTYRCLAHLCGPGKVTSVPLRNGTCVQRDEVHQQVSPQDYCGPSQALLLTSTGVLDCECWEGYRYWPPDKACYKLYSRGPCKEDEILAMTQVGTKSQGGRLVMKCRRNPCAWQENVAFSEEHGYCFQLDTQGPCKRGYTFSLNEATLTPGCYRKRLKSDKESKIAMFFPDELDLNQLNVSCSLGSVRTFLNSCPEQLATPTNLTSIQAGTRSQNSSQSNAAPAIRCQEEDQWPVINPVNRRRECRKIQCPKQDELLTTSGECLGQAQMLKWCSSLRDTQDPQLALNAHGTVECECGRAQVYWPEDRKCYDVYSEGPCARFRGQGNVSHILVYTGGARLKRTNGLECVPNPCKNPEEVVWKQGDGKCHQLNGLENPYCGKDDHQFIIDPDTLKPACVSIGSAESKDPLTGSMQGMPEVRRASLFGMLAANKACKPGSFRDYKGQCQAYIEFSFG